MLKVLIVDDNARTLTCLGELIPWDAIDCTLVATAQNGNDGLILAQQHEVDIVICDIVMPVMDGAELCRRLHKTMPEVAFVFLSAYKDFETAKLAIQYGVCEYILKPLTKSKIEYIADLLQSISIRKEAESLYFSMRNDPDMDAQIIRALENADQQFIDDVFQRLVSEKILEHLQFRQVKDIAYHLVTLLHVYMKSRNIANFDDKKRDLQRLDQYKKKEELLEHVRGQYFKQFNIEYSAREQYNNARMQEIVAYLDEHFTDSQISVSSVADHFSYSSDYLGRLFSHFHHQTISEYIVEKRFERAVDLLCNTNIPVTEVIRLVGYVSHSFFFRVFRERYHMAPGEFRNRHSSIMKE